ncbi:unnamed protein product [Rhizophagus irregularis]|nr:unnamed protein product [Rhizophagus irregularis]
MDIRAVVAIDFGTTFSGFAYTYRSSPEIITNDSWPQQIGPLKTNTVLQYDSNYQNVIKWGNPALAQRQSRRSKDSSSSKTVELIKLHLGNIPQNEKPSLPRQLNYEKAISDYLRELASFMVVDCGGGTVDLTTRKLLRDNKLSEITERTGDFCGGSYVDREFIKFLSRRLGKSTINLLKENNYGQMQYMIQQFCQKSKFHFTGDRNDFDSFEFDIEEICPILKQYCKDDIKEKMEDNDWIIDINFEDIKSMFDPVVGKIIRLIRGQLNSSKDKCSVIFL